MCACMFAICRAATQNLKKAEIALIFFKIAEGIATPIKPCKIYTNDFIDYFATIRDEEFYSSCQMSEYVPFSFPLKRHNYF